MRKKLVYLAGPIFGCDDAEANVWRTQAADSLGVVSVRDPMRRDYRGREAENVADIVEGDKADILACTHVLVYYSRPSAGTSMEILHAWLHRIPVILINANGGPLSPWLTYHATAVYSTLEDALAALA